MPVLPPPAAPLDPPPDPPVEPLPDVPLLEPALLPVEPEVPVAPLPEPPVLPVAPELPTLPVMPLFVLPPPLSDMASAIATPMRTRTPTPSTPSSFDSSRHQPGRPVGAARSTARRGSDGGPSLIPGGPAPEPKG